MNELKEWWNKASTRDQLSLAIGGGILLLYLCYMVLLKPVTEMRDNQLRRNMAQAEALERVRELAATWINREGNGENSSNGRSLVDLVNSSLQQNSLRMTGMQPSGANDVRLRLEQVPFDNLLAWLYDIEVSQRLQVKDISVATGSNEGLVSVNIRLHRE
ncbi:type II secretion system protein M [Teredinibacter turnerae]|uniref:type II secretion system protein M n=1 Tax=Teredinibacter turnerae TaxID=2426 RepID=UPI0003760330|nr:type II secretion system protein M [Teredinibacter turnerae]